MPDLALMVSDVLVAFDHLRHEVTMLANVFVDGDDVERAYAEAVGAIADVRERLAAPVPRGRGGRARAAGVRRPTSARTGYADAVERARSTSAPATSTRWCRASAGAPMRPVEAFSIYRGLRAVNPSPYMYFLDFEDFEIAGASPESLVKVSGRTGGAAPDRRHAAARRDGARRTSQRARSCWPTRRSAPST